MASKAFGHLPTGPSFSKAQLALAVTDQNHSIFSAVKFDYGHYWVEQHVGHDAFKLEVVINITLVIEDLYDFDGELADFPFEHVFDVIQVNGRLDWMSDDFQQSIRPMLEGVL